MPDSTAPLHLVLALLALWLPALALSLPVQALRPRRSAGLVLALAAVLAVVSALFVQTDPAHPTELVIEQGIPIYEGQVVERKLMELDRRQGNGISWRLVLCGWCSLFGILLLARVPVQRVWLDALLYGLLAPVVMILLQITAAPAPFSLGPSKSMLPALETVLLPAAVLAGQLLARGQQRFLPVFFQLVLFVSIVRAPVLIAMTVATTEGLGTSLDVSQVTWFADIYTRRPVETYAGSPEQLRALVYLPQAVFWPAISFLFAGGLAFLTQMWGQYQQRR